MAFGFIIAKFTYNQKGLSKELIALKFIQTIKILTSVINLVCSIQVPGIKLPSINVHTYMIASYTITLKEICLQSILHSIALSLSFIHKEVLLVHLSICSYFVDI